MEANKAIDKKAKAKQLVKQGYHLCQRGNYPDGAKYFKEAATLGDLEAALEFFAAALPLLEAAVFFFEAELAAPFPVCLVLFFAID